MSNFTERVKKELELASLYEKDSDYEGMIGVAVEELCEVFSKQGHSGMSATITKEIFSLLVDGKTLTPITSTPEEWAKVLDDLWQNKRRYTSFSRDGGKTWYDIDDESLNNGDKWVRDE
jgi:hypothetical protein